MSSYIHIYIYICRERERETITQNLIGTSKIISYNTNTPKTPKYIVNYSNVSNRIFSKFKKIRTWESSKRKRCALENHPIIFSPTSASNPNMRKHMVGKYVDILWIIQCGGWGCGKYQDHIIERHDVSRPFPPALPPHSQNTRRTITYYWENQFLGTDELPRFAKMLQFAAAF